jgi:hypothetical protein
MVGVGNTIDVRFESLAADFDARFVGLRDELLGREVESSRRFSGLEEAMARLAGATTASVGRMGTLEEAMVRLAASQATMQETCVGLAAGVEGLRKDVVKAMHQPGPDGADQTRQRRG